MHSLLRRIPRLQLIAVFEAAARRGSFTAAARELGMSQSAVSRHIDSLEREIDHRLFDRSANRVTLNQSGESLLLAVQRGLDTIDRALDAVIGTEPTFSLAANPGFAQQWLVPYMDEIQALFGTTTVRLRLFDRESELRRDSFDAAIHLAPLASTGLESRSLFAERVLPIASPDLARATNLDAFTDPQVLIGNKQAQVPKENIK